VNDSDFIAYENHRLTVANAELRKERDELEHRIKRMEEAGDAMDPMNDTECECDDRSVLICKYCFDSSTRWFKAKEAKP